MSKERRKIDDRQLSIFERLKDFEAASETGNNAGQFKIIDRLRASIREAMKHSLYNRYQIAGEMSHLLAETITKEQLDSWTRESDEVNGRTPRHIPAEYLLAFCKATGCNDPLIIIGRAAGLWVLPGPDALRAEIQHLDERVEQAKAEKRRRVMFLREMER